MKTLLDALREQELSGREKYEYVRSDRCARCGCEIDPDVDDVCVCDMCRAEIEAEIKAFLNCYNRYELICIDWLRQDDVWELSGRPYFSGNPEPDEPEPSRLELLGYGE
jgi:methionyl-tRNA synthetase